MSRCSRNIESRAGAGEKSMHMVRQRRIQTGTVREGEEERRNEVCGKRGEERAVNGNRKRKQKRQGGRRYRGARQRGRQSDETAQDDRKAAHRRDEA